MGATSGSTRSAAGIVPFDWRGRALGGGRDVTEGPVCNSGVGGSGCLAFWRGFTAGLISAAVQAAGELRRRFALPGRRTGARRRCSVPGVSLRA